MKHKIKTSLFAIIIAHIVLGAAAIHAMMDWLFGGQASVQNETMHKIPIAALDVRQTPKARP